MLDVSTFLKRSVQSLAAIYVGLVLFGAPVSSDFAATGALTVILYTLVVLPVLFTARKESEITDIAFFEGKLSKKQKLAQKVAFFTLLGCWLSAFVIPLDWDRWWQRYPLPNFTGSLTGAVVGFLVHTASSCLSERFGNYDYNDVPELKGIFFAEFDNVKGPTIRHQTKDAITKENFDIWSNLIIPKPELFGRLLKISMPHEDCKILGYPIGMSHSKYSRESYTFNTCFVVASTTNADSIYEPIVQKVAEYFVELEQENWFLSEHGAKEIPKLIDKMFNDLTKNRECVYKIDEGTTLYFKLCPSYRGIEPPEVSIFMVPMFVRDVKLTQAIIEKMDVLSQRIIPMIDGIQTVKEIADGVSIDQDLVVRCVRNLHFYECVSLVPMFLYSNTYVATERVQDFYKNKDEITECLSFVRLKGSQKLPVFSDVFRLYLSMKCGKALIDWVYELKPREMGVDEHRLVQFGMHHQFLRKLTIYPVCTEKGPKSRLMLECNGTRSLEDIALNRGLDPHSLKELLEKKKNSFEFIMK